jgi:hypothetical protein
MFVILPNDTVQYLGQYVGFIFDRYSIMYFGDNGILRLDYRIPSETKSVCYTGHSSCYILLETSNVIAFSRNLLETRDEVEKNAI